MQDSTSPSQMTRDRAKKLKEILDYMQHTTQTALNEEIKFDLLDDFYQFLTKFGTDEAMSTTFLKSPCSTQFSELNKKTRSKFISSISRFLFEMEKNRQVIQDLQNFIDKGEQMKILLKAKSYNAYHALGNELNRQVLGTITDNELQIALKISKDVVHAITSFNFSEFQEPGLAQIFNEAMNKLHKALDAPKLVSPSESKSQAVEVDLVSQEQEIKEICDNIPSLEEQYALTIPNQRTIKIRGEGVESWKNLINLVDCQKVQETENEMKKLESEQRREVMVKSLCLTNLMMKIFRQDYNRLLKDIETVSDEKMSLKYILSSNQLQEQIQKLKAKPKKKIKKVNLPLISTFSNKQTQHWKKVLSKGETIKHIDLLKFNKPIIHSFSRAAEEKKPQFVKQVPYTFESQRKPLSEVQNVNQEKVTIREKFKTKRQNKEASKRKERSSLLIKVGTRRTDPLKS